MIKYFNRIMKLILFCWNPGIARVKVLAILVYSELLSLASRVFIHITGFNDDWWIFGGPVLWSRISLTLAIAAYFMYIFIREGSHATKLLKKGVLPCTKCGYPLPEDVSMPCPECGIQLERSKVVKYWKDCWLVDPHYFCEMEKDRS